MYEWIAKNRNIIAVVVVSLIITVLCGWNTYIGYRHRMEVQSYISQLEQYRERESRAAREYANLGRTIDNANLILGQQSASLGELREQIEMLEDWVRGVVCDYNRLYSLYYNEEIDES